MSQDRQLQSLLIELGTEELPPKSLKVLSESFAAGIEAHMQKLGFAYEKAHVYGAPRRLAVKLSACQRVQQDKEVEKRGPAVNAAFDADGKATKAAQGWARANGIEVEQAQRLKTDKGEWLLHKALVKGQSLDALVTDIIEKALKQLPIPKAMRWGDSEAEFIRPVHTLVVMYGNEVIETEVLGIKASNELSGHRFHGEHRFPLDNADNYESALHGQYVIADYSARMQKIEAQLQDRAKALGLKPDYDQSLLEEISSLVEWPVVLKAQFEEGFLQVPKEALIYTMKDDQKYVPLLSDAGSLSESFLFVSNIESKDPSQVIAGNEKVIRPRLADAEFFFETDKKTSLASKAEKLKDILFQKSLGSIADKSQRVANVTQSLGARLGMDATIIEQAKRAAYLAKADLVCEMVMEFPSVQGTMGKHYALHDGEDEAVALAIEEQYLPRFAKDSLPESQVGMLLSLSEKLDTLVGIFGVNLIPKGDKDPFALRRSAIGILRMLVSFDLKLDIRSLISDVADEFGDLLINKDTKTQVTNFLFDRLKPFYADQGISGDIVNAVLGANGRAAASDISDIHRRVLAVSAFTKLDSASSLVAANKRVSNILAKNADAIADANRDVDESLLSETPEQALFKAYSLTEQSLRQESVKDDYNQSLLELTALKEPLDAFFDGVMIMSDDEALKNNRIRLVSQVRELFLSIADISLLNI